MILPLAPLVPIVFLFLLVIIIEHRYRQTLQKRNYQLFFSILSCIPAILIIWLSMPNNYRPNWDKQTLGTGIILLAGASSMMIRAFRLPKN